MRVCGLFRECECVGLIECLSVCGNLAAVPRHYFSFAVHLRCYGLVTSQGGSSKMSDAESDIDQFIIICKVFY